jgi:hypothetical protein
MKNQIRGKYPHIIITDLPPHLMEELKFEKWELIKAFNKWHQDFKDNKDDFKTSNDEWGGEESVETLLEYIEEVRAEYKEKND